VTNAPIATDREREPADQTGGAARRFAGWVRGDHFGLAIPAEPEDLRSDGIRFLTEAFRASGALALDNAVTGIAGFEELAIGGTGRKLRFSVVYARPDAGLPGDIFVKFSRNSDDRLRDRLRHHMREEIMLGLASRTPGFPVNTPLCLFADFEAATGTGLLITECVRFGENGVEPCHVKCRDHTLDDALDHYRTLVRALARLAGSFASGEIGGDIARFFPTGSANVFEKYQIAGHIDRILKAVEGIEQFDREHPRLVYHGADGVAFFATMRARLVPLVAHAWQIGQAMHGDAGYVSLCHFNANIDNAWFWTDAAGQRQCGLLDWGMVGQMHVALALWGCLSGAEPGIWEHDIDALIGIFIAEFRASGGPALDPGKLGRDLSLFAIFMALSSLLDAPAFVRREIPGLKRDATRCDPEFAIHENARVQLHILNNFLRIWDRFDFEWLEREAIGAC
jgi:hypothetical protein